MELSTSTTSGRAALLIASACVIAACAAQGVRSWSPRPLPFVRPSARSLAARFLEGTAPGAGDVEALSGTSVTLRRRFRAVEGRTLMEVTARNPSGARESFSEWVTAGTWTFRLGD